MSVFSSKIWMKLKLQSLGSSSWYSGNWRYIFFSSWKLNGIWVVGYQHPPSPYSQSEVSIISNDIEVRVQLTSARMIQVQSTGVPHFLAWLRCSSDIFAVPETSKTIRTPELNLNSFFSRFFSMGHFASQAWSPLHLAKSIITSLTLKTFLPFTFPPCSTFLKYNFFTSKAQYKAPTAFHRPNVLFYNKAPIDREKQIFQLIELCSFSKQVSGYK